MTWVKVDDAMPTHPKISERSDAAFRAIVRMWCHSAQHQTDGHIAEKVAREIAKRPKVINELVEAGLLHRNGTGWMIHDWLDFNISSADARAKHEAERARLKAYRDAKK